MSILLKNATYIDWETLKFIKTHIIVKEGVNKSIKLIDKIPDSKFSRVIDCNNKYVTKSFACGHHHVYSALSRGMHAPQKSPQNFVEILKYIWWTLDKNLNKELIEYSALVTAIACAKNGVTFAIDHHASPYYILNSLETIAKAFDKVGVSHLLCYEISDRDGTDISEKGLNETDSYLQNHQGLVGLHASFTVSDDTLSKAVELVNLFNSGIHIHVAEDIYDQEHSMQKYGMRVVERLQKTGALNSSKTILGHCLHLSENEKQILKNAPSWIVQNTESNLNNNVGYFNAAGIGENIMLGTDGMHSDMLQSAKASFFVGQGFDNINYNSAYKRFRNAHNYLNQNDFKGDGENNLVILDYDSPTEFTSENFLGHFIFGLNSKHVQHVISDGKLIVDNKKIITVNEEDILSEAQKLSKHLWDKMSKSNFYK